MPDWKNLRLQYELLDQSAEDLAIESDISLRRIQYAIDHEEWAKMPLAEAVHDWKTIKDLDQFGPEAVMDLQRRVGILNILKSQALNPRYIALEAAMLSKATGIISAIDASLPTAAAALKNMADVFESLAGKRQAVTPVGQVTSPDGSGSGLRITVINKFEAQDNTEHKTVRVNTAGPVIDIDPKQVRRSTQQIEGETL